MWATPQAQKLLSDNLGAASTDEMVLPEALQQWLAQAQASKADRRLRPRRFPITQSCGCIIWATPGRTNSCCGWQGRRPRHARFVFQRTRIDHPRGRSAVLAFQGQDQSRHRADPGIEPRTVDKHLEQIYAKLGVENRTAAAAIAANATKRTRRGAARSANSPSSRP